MKLTSHRQFFFRPQHRIFMLPWRSLECGSAYPKEDERCIYYYSVVKDCDDGAVAPFYVGQRRHAHLLGSSLGLRRYKRWWPDMTNKMVRCDVFLIGDRHFNPHYSEHTNNIKLMSIEYLSARLIERRLRQHHPLLHNQGFQFTYSFLKSKDVRSVACGIYELSKTIWTERL